MSFYFSLPFSLFFSFHEEHMQQTGYTDIKLFKLYILLGDKKGYGLKYYVTDKWILF